MSGGALNGAPLTTVTRTVSAVTVAGLSVSPTMTAVALSEAGNPLSVFT